MKDEGDEVGQVETYEAVLADVSPHEHAKLVHARLAAIPFAQACPCPDLRQFIVQLNLQVDIISRRYVW